MTGDDDVHNTLWSVAEEVLNPADEQWRDVEMLKFPDYVVALICDEGRVKVNKNSQVAW